MAQIAPEVRSDAPPSHPVTDPGKLLPPLAVAKMEDFKSIELTDGNDLQSLVLKPHFTSRVIIFLITKIAKIE
jgi:hypothetical protein